MENLIASTGKALVDNPAEVVVTEINGTQSFVIELKRDTKLISLLRSALDAASDESGGAY